MSDREMIVYCGMANCEYNIKRVPPYSEALVSGKPVNVCGSDSIYVGMDIKNGGTTPICLACETRDVPIFGVRDDRKEAPDAM